MKPSERAEAAVLLVMAIAIFGGMIWLVIEAGRIYLEWG